MAAISERIYQKLMDLRDEHENKLGKQTRCEGQLILKMSFWCLQVAQNTSEMFSRISAPKSQTKSK